MEREIVQPAVAGFEVVETLPDGSLKARDASRSVWLLEPVPDDLPVRILERARNLQHLALPRLGPVAFCGERRYLPVEWPEPPPAGPVSPDRLRPQVRRLCEALDLLWRASEERLPFTVSLARDRHGHLRLARLLEGPPSSQPALLSQLAADLVRVYSGQAPARQLLYEALPLGLAWALDRALSESPERSFDNFDKFGRALTRDCRNVVKLRRPPDERRLPPVEHRKPARLPPARVAGGLVLLTLLGIALVLRLATPVGFPPTSEPCVVVAGRTQLWLFSAEPPRRLGRLELDGSVGGLAASDQGLFLATLPDSGQVLLFDLRQGRTLGRIRMDGAPSGIQGTGADFLVVDPGPAIVLRVRLLPRSAWAARRQFVELGPLFTGGCPRSVAAVGLDRDLAYVADPCHGQLTVYDLAGLKRLATRILGPLSTLAASPDGKVLYVALPDRIVGLDARTLATRSRIRFTGGPVVRLLPSAHRLWALHADGTLSCCDPGTDRLLLLNDLGCRPVDAVMMGSKLWVAASNPPRLVILDPERPEVRTELPLPAPPQGLTAVPRAP
ncbi:MAG: hypothetical protein AB1758_11350 [Candidatus Eremiobacterota bacterium]